MKNGGDAEFKVYCETIESIVKHITPMLAGHKFLFGDKMTNADFILASFMGSLVYNNNLGMGEAWSAEAKKIH